MKLLLTSGGLTNKSIARALFELVGKKPQNTKIVFIPTAANMEDGGKVGEATVKTLLKRKDLIVVKRIIGK